MKVFFPQATLILHSWGREQKAKNLLTLVSSRSFHLVGGCTPKIDFFLAVIPPPKVSSIEIYVCLDCFQIFIEKFWSVALLHVAFCLVTSDSLTYIVPMYVLSFLHAFDIVNLYPTYSCMQ